MNDFYLLAKDFIKVIEVDLNEDTYFEVKVDESYLYKDLRKWVDAFLEAGAVYEEDIPAFKEFFKFDIDNPKMKRVFYRRKEKDGNYRLVCMEVVPFSHYSPENAIVLIFVRGVEDSVKDYKKQFGNNKIKAEI